MKGAIKFSLGKFSLGKFSLGKFSLGVAALGSLVLPMGAHAALGTQFGTFRIHADGSHVNLGKLPAGVYDLTVIGTYVYDKDTTPALLADGECSVGSDAVQQTNTVWHDPIDTATNLTTGPGVVSTWHRWRYGINGDTLLLQKNSPLDPGQLIYTGDILDDTLDVYVGGDVVDQVISGFGIQRGELHAQAWVPTYPTLLDNGASGGVVTGCNLGTHQYDTVIVADGEHDVKLGVFDTNYIDNLDMKNSGNGPSGIPCTSSHDPDPDCGLVLQVGQLIG